MAQDSETAYAKAYQAIGEYFCAFSELEQELGETIMVILRLQDHEARDNIIAALGEIDITKKIGLVEGAIQGATKNDRSEPGDWKLSARATTKGIWECIPDRNFLAHSHLEPKSDGSVDIARHGKLKGESWNKDKLAGKILRLRELKVELKKVSTRLQTLKIDFPIPSYWMMTSHPYFPAAWAALYQSPQDGSVPLTLLVADTVKASDVGKS
jgi:hypothetical protein